MSQLKVEDKYYIYMKTLNLPLLDENISEDLSWSLHQFHMIYDPANSPYHSGGFLVNITYALYLTYRSGIDNMRLSYVWHSLYLYCNW